MTDNLFTLTQKERDMLRIVPKASKPLSETLERLLNIFHKGKELGKNKLTLEEITAGYYNLYCKGNTYEYPCDITKIKNRLKYHFVIYGACYGDTMKKARACMRKYKHKDSQQYLFINADDSYTLIE